MKSRNFNFANLAFQHLQDWIQEDHKVAAKITQLLEECRRTPFEGKGKPEPLKGNYKGYWSRRITGEHRLIYKVDDDFVYIVSCRGHYDK